jgi:hypothetical protein
MRTCFTLFLVIGCGSSGSGGSRPDAGDGPIDGPIDAIGSDGSNGNQIVLTVTPNQLTARQHVGGAGETRLLLEFHVPTDLQGGGLPADLTSAASDLSIVDLELPQGGGATDESVHTSTGVTNFDAPRFCQVGDASCADLGTDGYWKGVVVASDGTTREVQLARSLRDVLSNGANRPIYQPVFGVFLPASDALHAGDRLQLQFTGKVTGRATDWTDQPLLPRLRYRTFATGSAGPWTVLDDNQVTPVQVSAAADAKFVRAYAPLDVQVGVPFTVVVVVTDHYGNPRGVRGTVRLADGVIADLQLNDEWRKEVTGVTYTSAGWHRIVPQLDGARAVYHYTMAWDGTPPVTRQVGDLHSHSGDGGAQRKFLGTFVPGDHRGLFARTKDALRYMHEVAGHDFGAVSEHAVRWDAYTPPPGVAADPEFQTGGACAGAGRPVPEIGTWWTRQQQIVEEVDASAGGQFIAFPAFEWHGAHNRAGDTSPLHRVVLFRDFAADAANAPLPILPGDIENDPPQCIIRFLADAGYTPDKALVIPHMMQAADTNIDWDLTYADSSVAPNSQIESYFRVGEIYSARAIDQGRAYGQPTLTVFESADRTGGRWQYRYGWRVKGAHIGLIGSSDNHEQMSGVNDDFDLDGVNYHQNEPGGYAVVLADTRDRGGIYGALGARRSYATSGTRAWLDYDVDGVTMGGALRRTSANLTAHAAIAAGLTISAVELWSAQVGGTTAYSLVQSDAPLAETHTMSATLQNPVAVGGAAQEWLYYVRVFLKAPGSTFDADEAVWSSPIWVTWSR